MRRLVVFASSALAACAHAAPAGADQHASVPFSLPDDPPPRIDPIPLHNMTIKQGQTITLSIPYTCRFAACDVRIGPRSGSGRKGASGAAGDFNPFLAVRAQLAKGQSTTLKVRVQALHANAGGKWFTLLAEQYLDGSRHYTDGTHDTYSRFDKAKVTIRGTYYPTLEAVPGPVAAIPADEARAVVPQADPPPSPVEVPADAAQNATIPEPSAPKVNPVVVQPGGGSCLHCQLDIHPPH